MSLPIEFVEKYKNLLGEEESSKFFTAILRAYVFPDC